MCHTCGCADEALARLTDVVTGDIDIMRRGTHEGQVHSHEAHAEDHVHRDGRTIVLQKAVLGKNDRMANQNRDWLHAHHMVAVNLVSSPGSGKTTLLERTIRDLGHDLPIQVIEGDQETVHDADRIAATGCRVVQINTGAGCHLDSDMVRRALDRLAPLRYSIVMIENVGNLVCPALFDLGESAKVVILSVTEGEDKPLKYPHMFRAARVMLLNKIDLLPHVRFDVDHCVGYARAINPNIEIFLVSALSGDGMHGWYDWLHHRIRLAFSHRDPNTALE